MDKVGSLGVRCLVKGTQGILEVRFETVESLLRLFLFRYECIHAEGQLHNLATSSSNVGHCGFRPGQLGD